MSLLPRFGGDQKHGSWVLKRWEDRLRDSLVGYVPPFIETYHLTLSTILWNLLILLCSFLAARGNLHWLWGVNAGIALQYLTDLLDGAVGRARGTGLIKWGYYMDHLMDYFFLCSILIGYSFLLPDDNKYILFFVQALLGGFMVQSFLAFSATNNFKISYLGIGPTEIRIVFIVINTLLIFVGKTYLAASLPYALGACTFGLCVVAYKNQKEIWRIDMENLRQSGGKPQGQ